MYQTRSPPLILVEHATLIFNFYDQRKPKMEEKATDASSEEMEFEPYTVHPAGVYRCRLEEILNLNTEFGPSLKFVWVIIDGELKDEQLSGLANKKLLPKSKLSLWARAHLNIASFPPDFVLKLNSLIGREVFLTVGVEQRKDGQGEKNTILAVTPAKPANGTGKATKVNKSSKPAKAAKADSDFSDMLSGQGVPDPKEYDLLPRSQQRIQE